MKQRNDVKRIGVALVCAVVLAGLGWCVRLAEDDQVGSSNLASLWVFVASGLFLYYAVLKGFVLFWRRRGS